MRSIQTSLIAGIAAAAAMAAPAGAADMPMVYKAAPVVVEQFGGWYLRGDIGMTNQKVKSIDNVLFDSERHGPATRTSTPACCSVSASVTCSTNWFRVDVTGEYRGKTAFRGLDTYPGGANDYYGTKSEWLFLANAYIDLGTWWCVTPFVGAGIGYSRNTIDNFRDVNVPNTGRSPTPTANSQWEMAWALHAGLAYKVTQELHRGNRLSLRQSRRFPVRRPDHLYRQQFGLQSDAVQRRHLARHQAGAALESLNGGDNYPLRSRCRPIRRRLRSIRRRRRSIRRPRR